MGAQALVETRIRIEKRKLVDIIFLFQRRREKWYKKEREKMKKLIREKGDKGWELRHLLRLGCGE